MKRLLIPVTLVTLFGAAQVQAGGVETCPTCGGTGVVGTKHRPDTTKTEDVLASYKPGPYEETTTVPTPLSLAGKSDLDRLPPVEVVKLAGPWRGPQGRFRNT